MTIYKNITLKIPGRNKFDMRINGFEQIKAFYSWVFNNPEKARPTHISLYLFLLNQNNRANWVEWFKCPYDLAMHGARIGNKGTYYKCLDDLKQWKIIDYKKGLNNFKAPLIKLFQLYDNEQVTEQVTVPLPEHLTEPQSVPLPVPLTGNKYKLLTNNLERIISNLKDIIQFLDDKLKNEGETWRDNFDVYRSELWEVYQSLINDSEFISEQQKFHPGVDISLSIEKACKNYWATKGGWKKKKQSRTKNIDWKATLTKAIDFNKVYMRSNYFTTSRELEPKKEINGKF